MLDQSVVQQLGEIVDDDVGAVVPQRRRPGRPGRRRRRSRSARVPGLDAGEGVLEHGRLRRLDAERRAPARNVSGCGLALQVVLVGDDAVDPGVEEVLDTGGLQHVAELALADTTARRSPASRAAST